MFSRKILENEKGTLGLPMRIVVLTIIGMVGFAAILVAVSETPSPPEPMYATANISELSLSSTLAGPEGLLITVLDRENLGLRDANVIIRSPDKKAAFSGVTNAAGDVRIELLNLSLPAGKNEGYLGVKVMKEGYRDYENEYFVKVTGA